MTWMCFHIHITHFIHIHAQINLRSGNIGMSQHFLNASYIRTILHELSRIHSHLLWLGLLADAFGFEALFYRSWTLREQILKIFESTCGGRVILSINEIGGL